MLLQKPLTDVRETGAEMRRLAVAYAQDVAQYASKSLIEFFNLLKAIPYREDPPNTEFLQRPLFTLTKTGAGGDCDDKAIAVASWAHLNNIPFRFIAVAKHKNQDLHHVFTEIYYGGQWVIVDATYSTNILGLPSSPYERRVIING